MDHDIPFERVGGYRVVRRLATGGTSDVLLARAEGPHGFERTVVLKLLLQQFRRDQPMEKMFAREAAAYARLSHPAIVKLYDFFSAEGQLVMVLEYIDGLPLNRFRAILRQHGEQVDDRSSIFVASRVFAALAAAHGARDPETGEFAPVIHRDVNPSNILIPWDGHVKLADFGIAKVAGVPTDTQSGYIKGTYGYMAPEQVRGEAVTVRTDVYAASLLLWELLARRKAVQRGALPEVEVLRAMASPTLPSLDVLRPDLPQRLRETIARGLEPSPEVRSVTAEEMLVVLRESVTSNEGRNVLAETLARVRHDAEAMKAGAAGSPDGASRRAPPRAPARMQSEASIDGVARTALGIGRVPAVTVDRTRSHEPKEAVPSTVPSTARDALAKDGVPSTARDGLSKENVPSTSRDLLPPVPPPTPRVPTPRPSAAGPETPHVEPSGVRVVSPLPARAREEKLATLGYGQAAPPASRPVDAPTPVIILGSRPGDPATVLGIAPVVIGEAPPPSRPPPPPPRSSPRPPPQAPVGAMTATHRSAGNAPPAASSSAMPPPPIPTPPVMNAYAPLPPPPGPPPPPAPPVPIPTPFGAQPSPVTGALPPRHFFNAPPPEPAPRSAPPAPPPVGHTIGALPAAQVPAPMQMPMARLASSAPLPLSVPPAGREAAASRKWVIVGALAIAASIAVVILLIVAIRSPKASGSAAHTAPSSAPTGSSAAPAVSAVAVAGTAPSAEPARGAAPAAAPPTTAAPVPAPVAAPARVPAAAAGAEGEIVTPARMSGHRVFVDGHYAGDSPGPIHVKCGAHSVKLGSHGAAHSVTVPCGGQVTVK